MKTSASIAIIGLTALEDLAVKGYLHSLPGCAARSFADFRSFIPFADDFGSYVADSATYLLHPEFFLPRKGRSAVVFRECMERGLPEDEQHGENPGMIFSDTDQAIIESILRKLVASARSSEEPSVELSQREREVLREICGGLTNKEIADRLCISVNTVITHRKNISAKVGIKSASGLSLYALMSGII